MRLLLISLYYPPDSASTGVIIAQLFSELERKGHTVTVVTTAPHYVASAAISRKGGWLWSSERHGGHRILRFRVPVLGAPESVVARMVTYLFFNAWTLLAAPFLGPQDLVFSPSPPLTNGVVAWLVGKCRRIPSVYNLQDIVPDAYIRAGNLKHPIPIALLRWLERFVYRRNTAVASISKDFQTYVVASGARAGASLSIPLFADTDFISPGPRHNPLSIRLGLDGHFVVMHAGTIGYRHGLDLLLDTAAELADLPACRLVIVGEGSLQSALRRQCVARQLSNLQLSPFVPRAELPALRASADVQLLLLRPGHSFYSTPCKIFEIMASQRPVIASVDRGSTIWRMVEKHGCGICVEPGDARALAAAIKQLHADPEGGAAMARRGRAAVVALYSKPVVVQQYEALFADLVRRRHSSRCPPRPATVPESES